MSINIISHKIYHKKYAIIPWVTKVGMFNINNTLTFSVFAVGNLLLHMIDDRKIFVMKCDMQGNFFGVHLLIFASGITELVSV